jgi:hypothetical protein
MFVCERERTGGEKWEQVKYKTILTDVEGNEKED